MPEYPIGSHGDSNGIEAETNTNDAPPPLPLPELCAYLYQKLQAFLNLEPPDPRDRRLRATQKQSRKSLEVIQEALSRYRYCMPPLHNNRATDADGWIFKVSKSSPFPTMEGKTAWCY